MEWNTTRMAQLEQLVADQVDKHRAFAGSTGVACPCSFCTRSAQLLPD